MQNRRGAPVWTAVPELRKLFRKEMVVSPQRVVGLPSRAVCRSSAARVVVALLVPMLVTPLPFNSVADLFAVVYLLLLAHGVPRAGRPRHRARPSAAWAQPRDDDRGHQRAGHRAGDPLARAGGRVDQPGRDGRPHDRRTRPSALSPGHILAFVALFIVMLAETGPPAGGQPGDPSRTDDDPRGDDPGVLGPVSGARRVGVVAEAGDLPGAGRQSVRAVGPGDVARAGRPGVAIAARSC